jgi:hypothetical protein
VIPLDAFQLLVHEELDVLFPMVLLRNNHSQILNKLNVINTDHLQALAALFLEMVCECQFCCSPFFIRAPLLSSLENMRSDMIRQ